jgi:hypothetical protein
MPDLFSHVLQNACNNVLINTWTNFSKLPEKLTEHNNLCFLYVFFLVSWLEAFSSRLVSALILEAIDKLVLSLNWLRPKCGVAPGNLAHGCQLLQKQFHLFVQNLSFPCSLAQQPFFARFRMFVRGKPDLAASLLFCNNECLAFN